MSDELDGTEGTQRFMKHFKVPKSEIKRIQKEYKDSKEASAAIKPEMLKEFTDLSDELFDFFEELTSKKINREVMRGNISYYLDEGFEIEDMKNHVRAQMDVDFFKENQTWFTISHLFPISDQKKINTVWDNLAYYQSLRKIPKIYTQRITLKCSHIVCLQDWKTFNCCRECILEGNETEIMINPYEALKILPEDKEELRNLAHWFTRHPSDLTIPQYTERTLEGRKVIQSKYYKKANKLKT